MNKPRGTGRPGRPGNRVEFLYEDDDIVAVDKPCGLPTISPEGARAKSLYDIVTAHIQKRNPKGRAAVVHRLDRDTSGVIVFAKNARAKTALMSTWNESVDERRYVAVVEGTLPSPEGVFDTWLSEHDPFRVREVPAGTRGALRAVTRYRVLAVGDGLSLVELSLETGRRHQIRAQLAAIGCPVTGDERYGARRDPAGRLCLHAVLIELERPFGGGQLRIESPAPPCFRAALRGSAKARAEDATRTLPKPGRAGGPESGRRGTRAVPRNGAEFPGRPADSSRAWPGGGPSARAGKLGSSKPAGERKLKKHR